MKRLLPLAFALCLLFALSSRAPAGVIMPDAAPTPTPTPVQSAAAPDEPGLLAGLLAWLGL